MAAFNKWTDPLFLRIDQAYAGHNWKDARSVWHPLADMTLDAGGVTGGQWFKDAGPKGMATELLEPRAFCTKGGAHFTFTAATLIVRLNTAFSWYTGAVVKIDGVSPSTLGLITAHDTISCDSAAYGLPGDGYVDVIVADGLAYAAHTCTITVNSPDASKFFSIVGFKEGNTFPVDIARDDEWIIPSAIDVPRNVITCTIENRNAEIFNVFIQFSTLVNTDGSVIADYSASSWQTGIQRVQATLYDFIGNETSGQYNCSVNLYADYPDAAGATINVSTRNIAAGSASVTATGSWFVDTSTPTSQTRQFTSTFTSTDLAFTFTGDRLDITFQTSAGWGDMGLYAANNTTLLHTMICGVDTGGALSTVSYTGFGAGSHTVHLRKTTNDGKFIVFVNAAYFVDVPCTGVFEAINLLLDSKQPVAMPVLNVQLPSRDVVTFDDPIPGVTDYVATSGPLRENTDMTYTETMKRFPTFAVCYQSGFRDTLSSYDRLIIDPIGAHAADVIYWQSLGIEVYGYIASSEEVGFYQNRYDFSSPLAPAGGSSPGGYATYYMYTKTPNGLPDKNGVWDSYFTNPTPGVGWLERVENYYMPQVIGGSESITDEDVTTKTATISSGTRIVFDSAKSPMDTDEPMVLTTLDGSHTYTQYQDYTFDAKTGAVVLTPGITPAVVAGQHLLFSYTRKGHNCDGVFWDVVDNADTYSSSEFGFEYVPRYGIDLADFINQVKANHPTCKFISNRGFTILPRIISSMAGVMFESWLTLPDDITDLANTDYHIITDPAGIAYNDSVVEELKQLRMTHVFDVYSLNYCLDGSDGDTLRNYCRQRDAEQGYMSWQSRITLDVPEEIIYVDTPGYPVETNAFVQCAIKFMGAE